MNRLGIILGGVVLAIIIASKAPPLEQASALLIFLLLAGVGAWLPLLGFIVVVLLVIAADEGWMPMTGSAEMATTTRTAQLAGLDDVAVNAERKGLADTLAAVAGEPTCFPTAPLIRVSPATISAVASVHSAKTQSLEPYAVDAMLRLMDKPEAAGQVFNLGEIGRAHV